MEHIFFSSKVLHSFFINDDETITPEYILNNYKIIIPEYQKINELIKEFEYLYENQLDNISEKKSKQLLEILHKYDINKYYNILIEHIIWKILRLEINPKKYFCDFIDKIINDIIYYKYDYAGVLLYLIKNSVYRQNMTSPITIDDFVFSIPLLTKYPFAYNFKKINLDYAIKYGAIDVIIYMYDNCHQYNIDKDEVCNKACTYGQLEIAQLAYKKYPYVYAETLECAAYGGNIKIIEWLFSIDCEYNVGACTMAATKNNFDILKMLHFKGCPWDEETCIAAAMNNNYEMLKWAHDNGCPIVKEVGMAAAINGNYEISEWLSKICC